MGEKTAREADVLLELEGLRTRLSEIENRIQTMSTCEEGFADFIENAPIGIYRTTPDGRILLANPAIVSMLGYESFDQLSLRNLEEADFEPDYPRSRFKEQIEARGFVKGLESVWIRRDGQPIRVVEHARAVRSSNGTTLFYEGTVQDVTHEKQADSDMQTLMDAVQDEVFLTDLNGVILAANHAIAQEFGIPRNELVGMCIYDLIPAELGRERRTHIEEVIRTRKGMQFHDRRGSKTLLHSIRPVFDGTGKVVRLAIHASDMTQIEELNRYRDKMIRTEQLASVGVLSAMAHHDIKRPLTVINLSIEHVLAHISKCDCSPKIREMLENALQAVGQLEQVAKDFLAVSKPLSTKRGLVRLNRVAEDTLNVLSQIALQAGLRFDVTGLEELPAVSMNQAEAERMFFCLVENAIQAADRTGPHVLSLSGRAEDAWVEIAFADDCGGIAPEHVDKIFEPFFTTKPEGHGTGLGLPVVQRILDNIDGDIRVDSRYGKGTTFHLRLPVSMKAR